MDCFLQCGPGVLNLLVIWACLSRLSCKPHAELVKAYCLHTVQVDHDVVVEEPILSNSDKRLCATKSCRYSEVRDSFTIYSQTIWSGV
jgi:hypothetical protein